MKSRAKGKNTPQTRTSVAACPASVRPGLARSAPLERDHAAALASLTAKEARLDAVTRELDTDLSDAEASRLENEEVNLEDEVEALRETISVRRIWRFEGDDAALLSWKHGVLRQLLADLDRFAAPDGVLASVRARLERARTIRNLTIDAHRGAWGSHWLQR